MAWYKTGTALPVSGSANVTGTGTLWVGNVLAGHSYIGPDRYPYEILSVNSNTSLTLAEPYFSASPGSAQPYKIQPTQGLTQTLAAAVTQLVADYSSALASTGTGKFSDGNLAAPGITFISDADTGFYRPASNKIGVTVGGVHQAEFSGAGLDVVGSVKTPTLVVQNLAEYASSSIQLWYDVFSHWDIVNEAGRLNFTDGTRTPLSFGANAEDSDATLSIGADNVVVQSLPNENGTRPFIRAYQMSFNYINNTTIRLRLSGSDNQTRFIDFTMTGTSEY